MAKTDKLNDDPLWYKDAIIYELRVRSFYDSNDDGIGDFCGLTQKLDYLEGLGITAIWLLPFYPSPLLDDGYDISDYLNIHPDCGTLQDFKTFLREAHRRGIRVITELVLNHTSDQHPWFQRARRSPSGSRYRDFYVWSDTPEKYQEARIIFKDFEISNWAWDPIAKAYFWHRFYSHQPDLNFDNPAVRKAVFQTVDFWFHLGVDGLRLDAVPYLYEREGTNCENLAETHDFLRALRQHVDASFPNRMLLSEANQWPEDAVAYFNEGTESHMAFHFPMMPRLFMGLRMEDRFPIVDILAQTPSLPDNCQWGLFLRNHDELTLEMVTEDERDFMYRAYAKERRMRINLGIRRRLAPLLGNNRRSIELMKALLLSLPGTPVLYYGDEIGMGDNFYLGDRNGVRTPMQWSADRNAGFSRANPQQLILPVVRDYEYHYEAINVEAQENNRHSLLWWMKRLIALRKQYQAFGRGSMELLFPNNTKILAYLRRYHEQRILVVANLSRFVQYAELDLSAYDGYIPIELFGQSQFPAIGRLPYLLTLSPYGFYWFFLEAPQISATAISAESKPLPKIAFPGGLDRLLENGNQAQLEAILPFYLQQCRWFAGKARHLRSVSIMDLIPLLKKPLSTMIALVKAEYAEEDSETYTLPLMLLSPEQAKELIGQSPHALIAEVNTSTNSEPKIEMLIDGLAESTFCRILLHSIDRKRKLHGKLGEMSVTATSRFRELRENTLPLEPKIPRFEQSNSTIIYGDQLVLKFYRRIEEGINPEAEITCMLSERHPTVNVPPLAAILEYRRPKRDLATVAVLQGFIANQGDAWHYTLDELNRFFERVLIHRCEITQNVKRPLVSLLDEEPSAVTKDMIGAYLDAAYLMGQRLADLHLALAEETENPDFAPEHFSKHYQRSVYQSMRNSSGRTMRLLSRQLSSLPEKVQSSARLVLDQRSQLQSFIETFLQHRFTVKRARCHGDLHLGQILYTGKDFVIIDFEGEPLRSMSSRRQKRTVLIDVAGMIRSFNYAVVNTLFKQKSAGVITEREITILQPWLEQWESWCSWSLLKSYLKAMVGSPLIPQNKEELGILLDFFILEKAIYELGYELNNRPAWAIIPLAGIQNLIQKEQ